MPASDPARPSAPVADLPNELIVTLQQAGVQFGTAVPNTPAIDRLRVQGPSADGEMLLAERQDITEDTPEE